MELFDTHCHLDVEDFDADRDEVLARCKKAGITRMLVPAVDATGWDNLLALCNREPGLYPALGLHPIYIDQHRDADLKALAQRLSDQQAIAVGEIGLDFYLPDLDRERQLRVFEEQINIANDLGLPVILHVRKAHDQVLSILRKTPVSGGIAHAFNGSQQQAQQYLELGFKLGFGGTLTYERANKIRRLATVLPIEAIVLETDAPDMVVSAHRGERNSPEYLLDCLHALSVLRDESPEDIAKRTTINACAVLNIGESFQ